MRSDGLAAIPLVQKKVEAPRVLHKGHSREVPGSISQAYPTISWSDSDIPFSRCSRTRLSNRLVRTAPLLRGFALLDAQFSLLLSIAVNLDELSKESGHVVSRSTLPAGHDGTFCPGMMVRCSVIGRLTPTGPEFGVYPQWVSGPFWHSVLHSRFLFMREIWVRLASAYQSCWVSDKAQLNFPSRRR